VSVRIQIQKWLVALVITGLALAIIATYGCNGGNPTASSDNPAITLKGGDIVGEWVSQGVFYHIYTRDGKWYYPPACEEGTYRTSGNYIREDCQKGPFAGRYFQGYYEITNNGNTYIRDSTPFGGTKGEYTRVK
jgi:hypothetical protein